MCVPVTFSLFENGQNILVETSDYSPDDFYVESIPAEPDAPPMIKLDDDKFNLVLCHGVEYRLYLGDSRVIDIMADLVITPNTLDICCDYYAANTVVFDGVDLCSDVDNCSQWLSFELY